MANTLKLTEKPTQDTNGEATHATGVWAVMYQTEAHLSNRDFSQMMPHVRSIEIGWELDLNNYEEVATVDFTAYPEGMSAFSLTQNGHTRSSWSRSARSGDIEGMTLTKPLEVDPDGREWGHRSMMTGDMMFNRQTGEAFVCAARGWMRFA